MTFSTSRTLVVLFVATVAVSATESDDAGFLSAMRNLIFGSQNNQTQSTSSPSRAMHPGHNYQPNYQPGQLPQAPQNAQLNSYPQQPPIYGGYQPQSQYNPVVPSGSACQLPQQIGTGPYRIPRWYFNPSRMRCELFYWSGCCGNSNNFQTFQACQQSCEVDPCSQDHDQGVGALQTPRFFFNAKTKMCEQFTYFGSGGNRNNFVILEECQKTCPESPNPCAYGTVGTVTQCAPGSVLATSCTGNQFCHVGATPTTTVCCNKPASGDRCSQPLNLGVGNANLPRWYFNPLTQQCQQCYYKGLQGNENNFVTQEECQNSCMVNPCARGVPYRNQGITVQCSAANQNVCPAGYYCHVGASAQTSVCCQALGGDPCGQPMDRGRGNSQLQRWYWNMASQRCLPFNYCGQKGTQNNFLSQQDCERTCYELDNPCALGNPQLGPDNRPLQCSLESNACGASFWCHIGAVPQTTVCCPGRVPQPQVCQQPMAMGSGDSSLPRWYYDAFQKKCIQFTYKGRYGNQNNFLTQQACESNCNVYVNVCPHGEPLIEGGRPKPCTFGSDSCGPNHWCHLGLVPDEYQCCPGQPRNPAACQGLPSSVGVPGAPAPPAQRWFFDAQDKTCKEFQYEGRKGNQNNFLTKDDCEKTCDVFVNPCNLPISMPPQTCSAQANTCGAGSWCHIGDSPQTTICCPSEGDPCLLPQSRGSGSGFLDRWYYDSNTGSCQPFTYTGLYGNQNNFLTREECEQMCAPNPCAEGKPFMGVDGRAQTCSASANMNTCPSGYWCHIGAATPTTVCCPGASNNICNLPMSTGEGNANLERFYYDPNTKTCRTFTYGGLKGNQNNFLNLRACQLSCQPLDNPCIGQPATTAAGQILFCSSTNKDTCPVNFWCHLGATPETTVCCPGATNPCSVPLAPGTGNSNLARWYYNPDDRECMPFEYNGKRGNQNNFNTQAECQRTCPEQLCLLSIDRGACGGRQTRFAFDRRTNRCISFEYTGCGGNLNNFQTQQECQSICGQIGF